jgi:hypothetical protein
MEIKKGKTGCAFDVPLDEEAVDDFVVIPELDCKVLPNLMDSEKPAFTMEQFKRKLDEACQRRDDFHRHRSMRAAVEMKKAQERQKLLQRRVMDQYWALDRKLRAADRRRHLFHNKIRDQARDSSKRVRQDAKNSPATGLKKKSDLRNMINMDIDRAASARQSVLQLTQYMAHQHNQHVRRVCGEKIRESKQTAADLYWHLDSRMREATRRRDLRLREIRTRAASPRSPRSSPECHRPHSSGGDSEDDDWRIERKNELDAKLQAASERREGYHEQMRHRSATEGIKSHVARVQLERARNSHAHDSMRRARRVDLKRHALLQDKVDRLHQHHVHAAHVRFEASRLRLEGLVA